MYGNIQKWGNSQAIRIPKPILESARFSENEQVEIIADEHQIIIRKATPHRTLKERFASYDGDYKCQEFDWGKPAGKEVW